MRESLFLSGYEYIIYLRAKFTRVVIFSQSGNFEQAVLTTRGDK